MSNTKIREAVEADFERILELNKAEEQQTSPLDIYKLCHLHELAAHHQVTCVNGVIAAFLLVMCDGAAYQNDNYAWFASHYKKFLYVDRIVVGADFSGFGIGSLMYRDLFSSARLQAVPVIGCEYNIEPPNIRSKYFHDKFGFEEVGKQHVANGTKLVSLQIAKT